MNQLSDRFHLALRCQYRAMAKCSQFKSEHGYTSLELLRTLNFCRRVTIREEQKYWNQVRHKR